MLLVLLLSFGAGFLLNEEQVLRRICRNMSYPHEGWLVMQSSPAFWAFSGSCLISFVKAIVWGELVLTTAPNYAYLAMLIYICSNIYAVKQVNGFYYTPWLTLLGLGVVLNSLLFQVPCTAICVVWLLSRNFVISVDAAILAGALTIFWLGLGKGGSLVLGALLVTWYFSSRQSPITARLIKYR